MALRMEVGLGPGHIVLDRDSATRTKGGTAPNFRPMSIVAKPLDGLRCPWYGGRPQPRRHCVRWGPSSPPPKGHSPQFSANVRCSQTAGLMKTPFGTEVDIGPGHIVLDGDPAPPPRKRGTTAPHFSAHVCCGHDRPSQVVAYC